MSIKVCPKCGSDKLAVTMIGVISGPEPNLFICGDCGETGPVGAGYGLPSLNAVSQIHYRIGERFGLAQFPVWEHPGHDWIVEQGKKILGLELLEGVVIERVEEYDPRFVGVMVDASPERVIGYRANEDQRGVGANRGCAKTRSRKGS